MEEIANYIVGVVGEVEPNLTLGTLVRYFVFLFLVYMATNLINSIMSNARKI